MKIKLAMCLVLSCIICFCLVGCAKDTSNLFLFGMTEITQLKGGNTNKAKKEMENFLIELEKEVSVKISTSDVSKINSAKANQSITVGENTINLLRESKKVYDETNGAFNPAVFPLTIKWGFSPENEGSYSVPRKPFSNDELEQYREIVDFSKFVINGNNVTKAYDDAKLDFGGVAKGYAADKCAEIAEKHGVKSGMVNVGGNIYCIGKYIQDDNVERNYNIAINSPRNVATGKYFAVANVEDTSVVQSGDFERYFFYEKKRYCHIISPYTLKPIDNQVIAVVVVMKNSAQADAYATAGLVLGLDDSTELFSTLKINAIIICENSESGELYYRKTGNIQFSEEGVNEKFKELV